MSQFKRSLTRSAFSIARSISPVLRLGKRTFVFRDADIREILKRDRDFTLSEVNGESIGRHIGPFILGMDDGEAYQADKMVLHQIVRRDDGERIRSFVRRQSDELLGELSGEFDMVHAYTRLLPLRLVGDYFGVPGPNAEDMYRWNRTLFWDVFQELGDNPALRKRAVQSAHEMNAYLLEHIGNLKAVMNGGGRLPDNLLTRLIALQQGSHPQLTDGWIASNIAGTFLGALEPTNKSMVNMLGQLYRKPAVLEQARAAALKDDVEAVAGFAWEALRFHPNAPALMRFSRQNRVIGGEGRKKRIIKAGSTLFLMTLSAMFDPRAVEQPKTFDPGRPNSTYLYFGLGLHTCYGNHVNFITLPEMLTAILKRPNLQPKSMKIVPEGPFADKWTWMS